MFWIGCCCHFERKVHLSRIGCSKLTCFNEFVLASWSLTGKPVKRLIQVNADTATHNVISCLKNTWRQLSLPREVCNCVIRWNDIMLRDFLCRTTSKQNKTGRPWFWFKDSYSRVLLSHWSPRIWWLSGPQMSFTFKIKFSRYRLKKPGDHFGDFVAWFSQIANQLLSTTT